MKSFLNNLSVGVSDKNLPTEQKLALQEIFKHKACSESGGIYTLLSKFRVGKIDVSSNGTGFLEVFDPNHHYKDLLIEPRDLKGAHRGDLVLAKRLPKKDSRPKAAVVFIIKRAFATRILYTKKVHKNIVGVALKTGLQQTLNVSQKSLRSLPKNTVLQVDNETDTIVNILGTLDDPRVDELIALANFGKQEAFSKSAEDEAKAHGNTVDKSMYPKRLDLTHLPFCTIDPIDAKDFDDAIYFDTKNSTLYVAIADVSEYVFTFGEIDKEAKERGFSIYFPHKSIPMLPRSLSEHICSLKPNEDRLSFCFALKLNPQNLKVTEASLHNVIIKSVKRYDYEEIDAFLDRDFSAQKKDDDAVLEWLLPLHSMMSKVRKQRLFEGFEFRSTDVRMEVDEMQQLVATRIESETPSHALIEDCMLLANKAAAERLSQGIFRNHEAPSFDKIEDLLNNLAIIGLNIAFKPDLNQLITTIQAEATKLNIREDVDKLIIKSQKKAIYESESKGHFGLGFKTYAHFTSPIRRYSDLLLHRLLKASLKKDKKIMNFLLSDIDTTCERISELERESDKVAWEYMDRKFARWAALNIGQRFHAIVTDINKTIIARLDDEKKGARLFLLDEDVDLLQRVEVMIVEADIANARIYAKVTKHLEN